MMTLKKLLVRSLFSIVSLFIGSLSAESGRSSIIGRLKNDGVVVSTKLVASNEQLSNAYNASIIEDEDRYLLIFRHDIATAFPKQPIIPIMKMVYLDKNFKQASPSQSINVSTYCPEDARVHRLNGKFFLTYNGAFVDGQMKGQRKIFYGALDVDECKLTDCRQLLSTDMPLTKVEKNWVPFEYPENSGRLHYIYMTSPYKIIQVDPVGAATTKIVSCATSHAIDLIWSKDTWGEIRGGTPARLVDGVYLTFFHSWKYWKKEKSYYYVMGAYIFQNGPPFKILAVTPNPIFFKDIYASPHRVKNLHVLFPSGFAIERKENKVLLHVSCGENDTSVRIVTIDKEALLKSMVAL